MEFYKNYAKTPHDEWNKYKNEFLSSLCTNNKVYKFIAFDDNECLNQIKLITLYSNELWLSYYKYLNDPNEFNYKTNLIKIRNKTGANECYIATLKQTMLEVYDICSFSYEIHDYMWEYYANNHNGFCLVFTVLDFDYFWYVEYTNRNRIPWDRYIIDSINNLKNKSSPFEYNVPMAYLPFVTKNPMNGELRSTDEKELRILYSAFDENEFNDGFVRPNVKSDKKYKVINEKWSKFNLKLDEVIIGKNCKYAVELEKYIRDNEL
jgi:hypothetical protein